MKQMPDLNDRAELAYKYRNNFNEAGFVEEMYSFAEQYYQQQLLNKGYVVRCKELLITMQHKEYNAIGAEGNSDFANTKADNRFKSLTHVLQMLDELPAL